MVGHYPCHHGNRILIQWRLMWRSPKAIIHCFWTEKRFIQFRINSAHFFSITAEIVSFNNSILTAALSNYMVPCSHFYWGFLFIAVMGKLWNYGIKFLNKRIPVSIWRMFYDFQLFHDYANEFVIFTLVLQTLINYTM